jgi:ComF family protein
MTSLVASIVDFALPHRCLGCGLVVDSPASLCLPCWNKLDFITSNGCASCGSIEVEEGLVCAPCLQDPPSHDGVRAATIYGEVSKSIALRLKHGRRIGLAQIMANSMERWIASETDVLVPVPLHRWRLWSRGFNQSLEIARHLGRQKLIRVEPSILVRVKRTPSLGGLGAKDRQSVLRGAIKVDPKRRARLKGKSVGLVDDVYTSGATANACAAALKRAGAKKVIVYTWARVSKTSDGLH